MSRLNKYLILICALLCPGIGFAQPLTLSVMADRSTHLAMTEIARLYARDANTIVNVSYASQATQHQQIIDGAVADALVTPLLSWIEELKLQGLVDVYSLTPVGQNRLAFVGPAGSDLQADWSKGLPTAQIIQHINLQPGFVIGNPATMPEGIYAKEALRNLKADDFLEPYMLYAKRPEEMFEAVITHGGYGLFFYSSVMGRSDLRIIDLVPENMHTPIQYYAVVLAGENMEKARHFLEYLKTPQAQKIFRDNGL